jgi:protein-L-isoaspartate O-methyltransferase
LQRDCPHDGSKSRNAFRHESFHTNEHEYAFSSKLVEPGDWVLDIGTNVGHYTIMHSKLMGDAGRVVAFVYS